jgi:hypothetical protein
MLLTAAMLFTLSSVDDARAAILVPWESLGYMYETPIGSGPLPGDAAFGSNPAGPCPLDPTVNTIWPINSDIRITKGFVLPSNATNLRVLVAVDNDVLGVEINSVPVGGFFGHEGCAVRGVPTYSVPDSTPGLVFGGLNTLEVTARDRGVISYLDVQVEADLITCLGKDATIFVRNGKIVGGPGDGMTYAGALEGTSGDDVIVGTSGSDLIKGFAGNDRICGGDGNDRIEGGFGNDVIDGEGGNDLIKGQQDNDTLFGSDGNDTIEGGPGNDCLDGGAGNNALNGESGTNTCTDSPTNTFQNCIIVMAACMVVP